MSEILFGFVSGIVAALGMGGGTILILLLNLFGNIDQHTIQGINLVFFIPTSIVAIFMNIKHKSIDYKLAKIIIFWGIVGSVFGSILSFYIENKNLKKYYGIFLLVIAIFQTYTFFKNRKK